MKWAIDLSRIPAFPAVATQLFSSMAKDPIDLKEISRLISSDAALTAMLLAHANSARYGSRVEISEVEVAIARLGVKTTREVVSASIIGSCFSAKRETEEVARCWRHTFATAILSEELAPLFGISSGSAYAAGLLHDIGRMALSRVYSEKYIRMIEDVSTKCLDIVDEEKRLFGVEHTEAGRWLAKRWKLPSDFALVAGRHHDRVDHVSGDILSLVQLACHLANGLGFAVFQPHLPHLETAYECLPPSLQASMQYGPEEMCARITARLEPFQNPSAGTRDAPVPNDPQIGRLKRKIHAPQLKPKSGPFEALQNLFSS